MTPGSPSPGRLAALVQRGRDLDPRHHVHLIVWTLIVISFGSFRSRGEGALLTARWLDGQVLMEIAIWMGLGLLCLYALREGWLDLRRLRFLPLGLLAAFIVFAGASSLYAPSLPYAGFRAAQLCIALLLVLMPGVDKDLLYKALAVYALMNLASAGLEQAPRVGLYEAIYRLNSRFGHASVVGIATAVGGAGLWARWLNRGLGPVGMAGMLVLIFANLATVSRTAIFGMVVGMLAALAFRPRLRGFVAAGWGVLGVAVLELFTGGVSEFLLRGQDRFELVTLTERTIVWEATLRRLPDAGLLGEGLGSTRFRPPVETVGLGHAHNILLEALVTLGLIGGILLVGTLVLWGWRLVAFRHFGHGSWSIRLVDIENLAIFVPLIGFCVLDRGFLALGDPLLPIYFAALRIAQDDNLVLTRGSVAPQRVPRRRRRLMAEAMPSHTKGRSSIR